MTKQVHNPFNIVKKRTKCLFFIFTTHLDNTEVEPTRSGPALDHELRFIQF
jgi:hypothetical protein